MRKNEITYSKIILAEFFSKNLLTEVFLGGIML